MGIMLALLIMVLRLCGNVSTTTKHRRFLRLLLLLHIHIFIVVCLCSFSFSFSFLLHPFLVVIFIAESAGHSSHCIASVALKASAAAECYHKATNYIRYYSLYFSTMLCHYIAPPNSSSFKRLST